MLIDKWGDDVLSSEHAHVLDEGRVVDAPDTKCPDVRIVDSGGGEDKGAEHCEELEETAAEGLSPLGEEVVAVRHVERFDIGGVLYETIESAEPVEGVVR